MYVKIVLPILVIAYTIMSVTTQDIFSYIKRSQIHKISYTFELQNYC